MRPKKDQTRSLFLYLTTLNQIWYKPIFCLFLIILLIYCYRKAKTGREASMCGCLSHAPRLGTRPATQACALIGNQTGDPVAHRLVLNPLSHSSQGRNHCFTARPPRVCSGDWRSDPTFHFLPSPFPSSAPECVRASACALNLSTGFFCLFFTIGCIQIINIAPWIDIESLKEQSVFGNTPKLEKNASNSQWVCRATFRWRHPFLSPVSAAESCWTRWTTTRCSSWTSCGATSAWSSWNASTMRKKS